MPRAQRGICRTPAAPPPFPRPDFQSAKKSCGEAFNLETTYALTTAPLLSWAGYSPTRSAFETHPRKSWTIDIFPHSTPASEDRYVEEVDRAFEDLRTLSRSGMREFGEIATRRDVKQMADWQFLSEWD